MNIGSKEKACCLCHHKAGGNTACDNSVSRFREMRHYSRELEWRRQLKYQQDEGIFCLVWSVDCS